MTANRKTRSSCFRIFTAGFLVMFFITMAGCEPLRKKFTRQKKKDQNEGTKFIPVLDPIEYPAKVESPAEAYKHYFSLWQVWDKELIMRVEEHASNKKINFTVNQLLTQLTEMEKFLTGEKQQQLSQLIAQINQVQRDLAQPVGIRSDGVIVKKIQRVGSKLREDFRFRDVEASLIK